MVVYIAGRLASTVPTVLLVTVVIFAILRMMPGGPAYSMLGEGAAPEAVAALERKLGLDQPLHVQYLNWLGGAVRGDLGRSAFGNQPVVEILGERVLPTAELALLGTLLSVVIGIAAGVVSAIRHNTPTDAVVSLVSIFGVSTPAFWLAILLVMVFSVNLRLLPSMGFTDPFTDPIANLRQMTLPSFTLGVVFASVVARQTRGAMLDVLVQDYVRTARAKGLEERVVLVRHALRNALVPVVTIIGLQLGHILGGAVIVETVFALPGTGQLLVTAIFSRDFPIVQGVVLAIALVFIFVNLVVDILYGVLDPRIRLAK